MKGNEIIKKLQGEIKNYHAKVRSLGGMVSKIEIYWVQFWKHVK